VRRFAAGVFVGAALGYLAGWIRFTLTVGLDP
jgi:hypothetical protein